MTIIIFLILSISPNSIIGSNIYVKNLEENINNIDKIENDQLYVTGEIIIKFKDEVNIQQSQGIIKSTGIHSIDSLNEKYNVKYAQKIFKTTENPYLSNIYKFIFSENLDAELVANEYLKNSNIEFAEPNYFFQFFKIPNDPFFDQQWALNQSNDFDIDAPEAWDINIGNSDIVIAILDTGVDYTHSDLVDNIWINEDEIPDNKIDDDENGYIDDVIGWDFGGDQYNSSDNDPMDFYGHGTHCAGIAAATTDNGIGISGIAWNCTILPVKVISDDLKLPLSNIANGIVYSVDNGADVISMSIGNNLAPFLLKNTIKYAYQNGVVLVSSAGNLQNDEKNYPAAYDEVIAVGATDDEDNRAVFSCYGDWVEVAAPGKNILSTYLNNSYINFSGTSMSCPYVAGVAALIKSKNNHLEAKKIREIILHSVDRLDPTFQLIGGRINARNALQRGIGNASSIINSPKHGDEVKSVFNICGNAFGEGFEYYIIQISKGKDPETSSWIEVINSTKSVQNGKLCSLNSEGLEEGLYIIRLKVICNDGVYLDNIWIIVNNEKNEYIVDDDGIADFTKIQDAIYASGNGDIIRVRNGTYYENLNIFKSIKLIGENRENTIIDGMQKSNVFNILSDHVQISGFTIKNSLSGFSIFLEKSNYCKISCNKIENTSICIKLESSKRNLIFKNYFVEYFVGVRVVKKSNGNLIWKNNFWTSKNESFVNHASFKYSFFNRWYNNYWQRFRILPYRIPYKTMDISFQEYRLLRNNFDWRPALKPHNIPKTSNLFYD